jgi:hypothetical protein
MAARKPTPGYLLLEHCESECRRVLDGWAVLNKVLATYAQPGANKAELEMQFLRIKSELARAIASLSGRMGGDCRFATESMNFLAGCTSLDQVYGQSEVAIKKLQTEWHRTFMNMNGQLGEMQELYRRANDHERVRFAGQEAFVPPPFPWQKVLTIGLPAVALVLLVGGGLFSRYFLGIGAPAAGVGMEVDQSLSNEDQVYVMMARMKRAFEQKDMDLLMSAFADDFQDVEGRSKTALRAFIQTFMSTIGTDSVKLDTSGAKAVISADGTGKIGPVKVMTPQINIDIEVTGRKYGNSWLITFIDEAK